MIPNTESLNDKSKNVAVIVDGLYSLLNSLDSSNTNKTVSIDFREDLNMLNGRPSMFSITSDSVTLYVNTIVHITNLRQLEVRKVINTINLTVKANLRS